MADRTTATGGLPLGPVGKLATAGSAQITDELNPTIEELSPAIEQDAEKCPEAQRLMIHPGVGPLDRTAVRTDPRGAISMWETASYLGLVPLEKSSGKRRRLGHITKQGSSTRFLLVKAAQVTVRKLPQWRSKYLHLMRRRGRKTAKVAMARKLAVRLYWMSHKGWDYGQWKKFGSHRMKARKSMVCVRTPSY